MPVNKTQLRRYSAIISLLNNLRPITLKDLTQKVSEKIDLQISRSTLDKDLARLKMEYDLPIKSGVKGVQLEEKQDFIQLLKNHLNLFD